MNPDDLDIVFHALAHRDRRRILDLVREAPGCRVDELSPHFGTSRIAVLKHLRVLESADLIHSQKVGRERHLYFNVVPILQIQQRWSTEFSTHFAGQLVQIKNAVESEVARTHSSADPRKRHA
jgi:predicted transcriptional regulator